MCYIVGMKNAITVDDLIAHLERVRKAKGGETIVNCGGFLGTNQGFTLLTIKKPRKNAAVSQHLNGYGELGLSIELHERSREEIVKGIKDMETRGYTFIPSQFRSPGEPLRTGVPICDWHLPW